MMRPDVDVLRGYGEMDECVRKMGVREGDAEAEKRDAEAGGGM